MRIEFKPWRKFQAVHNKAAIREFLNDVADTTVKKFRDGITSGPKTGRRYGSHQASAPGEYPAIVSRKLLRSIKKRVTSVDSEVGSNVFYSRFLADGTSKMAPRSMSRRAMEEAIPEARARMKPWAEWRRV